MTAIKRLNCLLLFVLMALTSVKARADVLAIRSNLLYDVVAAPNLGVEYGWRGRWSVMADVTCPWWVDDEFHNEWCYQMVNVGLEGRYWLHDWQADGQGKLRGAFVGLYANGGAFDLGHDRMGWQSQWFWTTGVSCGYAFRLNDHFRLECSLGIGYLQTDYTRYNTIYDGSGIYQVEDGTFRWFGPTRAGVTLIWTL